MMDKLDGFVVDKILDFGHDGFRGTLIEFGKWKGHNNIAVKYGVKNLQKHEASIMKYVDHVSIVRLMKDHEEPEDFIVIEAFGDGKTIHDVLKCDRKVPFDRCISWLSQLANAIKYLHQLGIIHHDIKDRNVLIGHDSDSDIDGDTLVKLCDFELSSKSENGVFGQGSTGWMAPELLYNSTTTYKITNKIDIYGFGMIFIKLIYCGRIVNVVKFACPLNIFDLMYSCTDNDPNVRPDMIHITKALISYDSTSLFDIINNKSDDNNVDLRNKLISEFY